MQEQEVINLLKSDLNFNDLSIYKLKKYVKNVIKVTKFVIVYGIMNRNVLKLIFK